MLYVTGGLIVVMGAYGAVSLQAVNQSTNLVFAERLMVAGTVARQIDASLSQIQGQLNDLGNEVGIALADDQPATAQDAMQALCQVWASDGHLEPPCIIELTDTNGNVLLGNPPIPIRSAGGASDPSSLHIALQGPQPSIADEFSANAVGHGSLLLASPVFISGQPTGAIIASVDLSDIDQRLAPLLDPQGPGYDLELLDQDGVVLASTQPGDQWGLSDHYPIVKDMLARRQAGTATHKMPAGAAEPTHIIAFVPLENAPWAVVAEEPQDIAMALPHALEARLFLFGAIVLLAGLTLAWVTTRAVVRPLNKLIDATQHIAEGNLDHPLDLAAEDEVGRLARSFGEMRMELKQSREEIAQWNRELEAHVRQRTRELTALVESSHALAATLNLDVLFDLLIKETREVVPSAEAIGIFLFDERRGLLVARSTFGFDAEECHHLGFRIGEGFTGKVLESQAPIRLGMVEDILEAQSNADPESDACLRRALGGRPIRSALGAALVSKGTRMGVLALYNLTRQEAFTENDATVLQAFANQAAAAIENARLYASLREKEAERAALLDQTIQAQEEERARVARDIHDELGQLLTRLSIDLKMCESQITAEPAAAAKTLAATQALVWQTMEQAHHLIIELRPTLLDELGLEAALRDELTTRLEPLGVNTALETDQEPVRLPSVVEITVFRIAQEAISNIARHAQARHATISLHALDQLHVSIEDDGVGIEDGWRDDAEVHRPLGLLGMQERATLIGATLIIEPAAPQGTRVTLRVPLEGFSPVRDEAQ